MTALKNSVQLIGNLGKEVELKTFENGSSLISFPLATNEYYTNSNGEKVTNTHWHNIVARGKLAELMQNVLDKGTYVLVRGKLVYRSYEDKEGNKRYVSEIVARDFLKLTNKES